MHNFSPTACPHCGKAYMSNCIGSHVTKCAMMPVHYAVTRAALDDGNGAIVSMSAYRVARPAGAISSGALHNQIGKWRDIAAAFELRFEPVHINGRTGTGATVRDCPNPDDGMWALEQHILADEAQRANCLHAYRVIDSGREVRYMLR